ncbi:hypothetical protein DSL72_003171 [Monilinia vaccinii-corymbosi]|uniref:LysM domain-containing protein n=1 Tax=Monilinia vaccinii-corymbosi TaxID=61207 RepID=A0A8A3NW73_9HELO|nr:hypothetical protein DSL72_003171 [Monilinia vaccinii-corymbosi]
MRNPSTTITLALLAMTIHASPIQVQSRDEMSTSKPSPSNTKPPAPAPAPPHKAEASTCSPDQNPAGPAPCVVPGTTTPSTNPATSTNAPVLPGTAANCTSFYVVASGDTCDGIGAKVGISSEELRKLNTQVNPQCTNLITGQALCAKAGGK